MGSNAKIKLMKDGELVAAQYKPSYRKNIRTTFRNIREEFANPKLDDNAVRIIKTIDEVIAFLRDKHKKLNNKSKPI